MCWHYIYSRRITNTFVHVLWQVSYAQHPFIVVNKWNSQKLSETRLQIWWILVP
jgi:hypothetical protein